MTLKKQLSRSAKLRRLATLRKYGVTKRKSIPNSREFGKLNRIYSEISRFKASGYEFVKDNKAGKALPKRKKLIQSFYPSKYSTKIKGYFLPRLVAGPNPKVKFTQEDEIFSVGAKGVPATDFVPAEALIPDEDDLVFTGDEVKDGALLDEMLAPFPDDAILAPVSIDDKYSLGIAGTKGQVRKTIIDWIQAYGWTPPGAQDANTPNNDMGHWFGGFKVLRKDEL